MVQTISILGSTGSIGTSTLKVLRDLPDRFEVCLLAAWSSRDALLAQIVEFSPRFAVISSAEDARWMRDELGPSKTHILHGSEGLLSAIGECGADITLSAIVGSAGLKPTMAAIEAGSRIALANKESMVVAGRFMNAAARSRGVEILPVDSEHNALHQCLRGERATEVKRLILTASGGPFRTYEGDFEAITPAQALRHPTWNMGPKITIDSATMMNKGLEVIEAHFLFCFPADQIDIVVHPQSIIHSMIQTIDGSYLAQLGETDMVHPILYALTYPNRIGYQGKGFDLTQGAQLEFFPVDPVRFPCIQLAYDALRTGGAAPCVLNAANEIAVAGFLADQIPFTAIPKIIRTCVEDLADQQVANLDDVLDLDAEARATARDALSNTDH